MSELSKDLQALISGRQHNRILRLSFPHKDGPDCLLLVDTLEAVESLSRPFDFTVGLLSDNANLELKEMLGKELCVELVRADGSLRYFAGVVFSFRLVKSDGIAHYEAKLGPWLNYLSLRKDNYIFHNKTLYQQTDIIFRDYSVLAQWNWNVLGDDPTMTDSIQFDETDSNFLERRWAQAGHTYYFEHDSAGHKLVILDDTTRLAPIDGDPEIAFQRHGGAKEENGIGDWSPVRNIMPASVALTSFDFKSPRPASTDIPTLNEQGKVRLVESYEYTGAHGFKNREDGARLARLRMEELEAAGKHFDAAGNNRAVMPGRWFRLSGHFNIDPPGSGDSLREFLILSVCHSASNNYEVKDALPQYENRLTCIRRAIPWRPGRGYNSVDTTIHGVQTARVVGPEGEDIHTDEYGRVKVQFHWDREGKQTETSSAWVRVATPWSGDSFGFTSIPRIGSEVLIMFLDGNPDRPIIMGMVPNAATLPPWKLPANKTQSGVLSRSTPGGKHSNANAFRFEDKVGAEQVWIKAERNLDTEVGNDETLSVGA